MPTAKKVVAKAKKAEQGCSCALQHDDDDESVKTRPFVFESSPRRKGRASDDGSRKRKKRHSPSEESASEDEGSPERNGSCKKHHHTADTTDDDDDSTSDELNEPRRYACCKAKCNKYYHGKPCDPVRYKAVSKTGCTIQFPYVTHKYWQFDHP